MEKKIIVDEESSGLRLDKFLVTKIPDLSRTKINSLILAGSVSLDGRIKKPSFLLKTGQLIQVNFSQGSKTLKPYKITVKIIYEDQDIIIVDKPTGLVVHPPQEGYYKTLVNALMYLGKDLAVVNPLRPGVVHRLDKETSGVMVLAKNQSSYKNLVEQFKGRKVKKEYIACVWGEIKKEKFNIDLPLGRDQANRLKMRVSFTKSKTAYTRVEVTKHLKGSTCLCLKPLTGRMHQLRVHLKFLGYPIAGDKKYGVKDDCKQLLLHARVLGFLHPKTNQPLEFTSPVPERFNNFIQRHDSGTGPTLKT
ncbi:MAG: RluA family pseudouridine synthase [Candidatus Omnitrophica bacterium]|nr:RluA family pseudouridine synthase [Candidatus Omnitrophota bacterium]